MVRWFVELPCPSSLDLQAQILLIGLATQIPGSHCGPCFTPGCRWSNMTYSRKHTTLPAYLRPVANSKGVACKALLAENLLISQTACKQTHDQSGWLPSKEIKRLSSAIFMKQQDRKLALVEFGWFFPPDSPGLSSGNW